MLKKIVLWLTQESHTLEQLGLMAMRMSFGIIFVIFGYNKLISGTAHLTELGSAMSFFGVTCGYMLWGYLAALTELCGGLSYVFGFCTRIASLPLIWLLIVAIKFHVEKGDGFTIWAFACLCLCIVVGFFIAGSGTYSVDRYLHTRPKHY